MYMKRNKKGFNLPGLRIPGLSEIQQFRTTRILALIMVVATMNLTQGCYYFKVNTRHQPSTAMVTGLDQEGKNFILHFNEKTFRLTDVEVNNHLVTGELKEIDNSQYAYRVKTDRPNRYIKKSGNNQSYLINEVHLYVDEYTDLGNNRVTVPVSSVSKVEIYDKDTATTTGSWVLSTLGVIAAVYLIMAIIVLIFKQSCPFVYSFDGESYHFEGEIFSGAIQPGLERYDYLRLGNLKPAGDLYSLKITNEIKEIQHINLAQLKVVDHPAGTEVLMDKYGTVHTLKEPVAASEVLTLTGMPVGEMTGIADGIAYPFNSVATTDATLDGVILQFPLPENPSEGKLIIRAKNSLWLEHVFTEFHAMFGGMYNAFNRKEAKRPAAEMRDLMFSQGVPLAVYIEKNGEWVFTDFYEVAGPMAFRDDVLSLDLSELEGEQVRIKLETGFMFWELDYAALDFSPDIPLQATTISALDAIDENGTDVSAAIRSDDGSYYVQPEIGNEALVTFPVPEYTAESRTVFLESKGYYTILRDQKGSAEWKTLRSFRDPGRMPQFSKELFDRFMALSGE
jgi:hypothetical protein